jgi:hypothetical protein
MRALYFMAGLCLLALGAKAQQNYDVSLIPKELMSYANTVIRYSDESVEVRSFNSQLYHIKQAITVLNKNGDRNARILIWYNKSRSIKSVKGLIFNAMGKPVGKFSERDFEDAYGGGESSLFEDLGYKRYKPAMVDYPYTVEYEYEVKEKQTLNLPYWEPNPDESIAVEKSSFTFTCIPDFKINYKEINTPTKAVIASNAQGLQTYTWRINNLKAVKDEPYSPDPEKYLTFVKIAPEKFVYEGISGSFTNWQELGKWEYDKLLANRDMVPAETISYLKQITTGITDPKLKAKKVYEYMQQKTRYVSVQVGIGGYQPFLAADVDRLNYGDCKALVYYTQSLLKTVGIDSWYCVVESGSRKRSLTPDFASMDQGDHVILCIPFKSDTTWLECTSQKIPFGFLSDFTDDRWVLACTPQSGKLLHTPVYTPQDNVTKRLGNFAIDDKGQLTGAMTTTFTGTDFEDRDYIIDEPYTEQVKIIRDIYPIGNFDIEKLEYSKDKSIKPVATEKIKLNSRDFASLNTDRFYFKINLANRVGRVPNEVRNRRTDVYINRGYIEDDEITYTLPAGYSPDKVLLNKNLVKPFGKYTVSMHVDGRQLVYQRRLQINDGNYPKDSYQDLVDFYQAVADADGYNMALVKRN